LEGRDRQDRPEDLLLEDAHLVVALEHGRLHVEALRELALLDVALAAGEALGPLLLADVDVAEDLLELLRGGLRADHRRRVEGRALRDRLDALHGALDEAVVDRLVHERPARAGADLALVEGEHREAFERLVEEVVVLVS
ncbi:carR, partial [Staphylococcus aureus]